jgi:hypothetical protein
MTVATNHMTCRHQREVELLEDMSTARMGRASNAQVVSSKMLADETTAECQAACGDSSPYRDVTLTPLSKERAVAMLQPVGYIDTIIAEFIDMGRDLHAGIRRAVLCLRRSA